MNDLETLTAINEIGYLLLKHGAEIYRVEESIQRMCEGLGFHDVEVFAIPSYFTLSLTLHDGTPYHSSKRSRTNRIHLEMCIRDSTTPLTTFAELTALPA